MAITFTNARQIYTDANAVSWDNQPRASLSFLYRYETTGSVAPSVLNTNYFIFRGLGSYFVNTQSSTAAGTLNLQFHASNATSSVAKTATLNVGTVYHIAVTYDQGQQVLWVNGVPSTFGSLTGNTKSFSQPVGFGVSTVPGSPFVFTLSDFALWNGYVLTATDVANMRDGLKHPPDVGGSATWRGRWTMSGTSGATVTLGDTGIANDYGDHTYDIKNFVGTGTAVYSNDLVWVPSATTDAYVETSGKTIRFAFSAVSNGSVQIPTAITSAPTISKNGTNLGPLINPWLTGYHQTPLYSLPSGTSISPGDVVTLSAPTGWATTPAGLTRAMDNQPAANFAGLSSYGTDTLPKTLRPGWNNAHLAFSNLSVYCISKNWRYRVSNEPSGVTYDANLKPIGAGGPGEILMRIWDVSPQTGVDQTLAFDYGLWAVGWDDLDPTHPTTCRLMTTSNLIATVTERTEYKNLGSGGIGIVKVFQITRLSQVTQPGSTNQTLRIYLGISSASGVLNHDNLVVYGPEDFSVGSPGTPTVLDRSDPYAISNVYLSRLANGVGSLRFADSLWNFGGIGCASEVEQVHRLSDWEWGGRANRENRNVPWTTARPWDQTATPYFYQGLFGSTYSATLASPINSSATVLTISNASTAPIIYGQRIKIGSELMRVLDVTGTSVTVERGTCATTPASHSAGSVEVQYRWLAQGNVTQGYVFELVGPTPHKLNGVQYFPAAGTWPAFTFADGKVSGNAGFYPFWVMPTGANTVFVMFPDPVHPPVTLASTVTLDATAKFVSAWPDQGGIPVEYAAKVAANFDGCNLHLNLPIACSNSLSTQIFQWVRDNYPAGRHVDIELCDEPWNTAQPYATTYQPFNQISTWLYPSTKLGWEWYVQRVMEHVTIARGVWSAAGRDPAEIRGMVNVNKAGSVQAGLMLEFAKTTLGNPLGVVSFAIYTHVDTSAATLSAYWGYDDEQAIDLYKADLRTNTTGYMANFAAMNSAIDAYNTKYGENVRIHAYEGGISNAAPLFSTTLSAPIGSTDTSFVVAASAVGLVAGTPILCESEWMTLTAPPTGNTLAVTRGAYGSTAASHALNAAIRTAWIERSHDLVHNPLWKYAEWELYAMAQDAGFENINQYALAIGASDSVDYAAYKWHGQIAGKGDGSDGKFDNRTVLCTPGKPASKASNVSQDQVVVSVRGQAFLDWMAATSSSGGGATYIVSPAGGINRGGHSVNVSSMHFAASGGERLGGKGRLAQVIVIAAGGEHLGGHAGVSAAAIHIVPAGGSNFGGSADLPSIVYNIYANDGNGGPVSYIEPVATVADTTWTTAPLAVPGDYIWHVRAADLITGLEEHNVDARVEVILDADGNDITGRPAPPIGLGASPLKGGKVRVFWSYRTPSGRAKPSEYRVYGGTPTISYATPLATIAYTTDGKLYTDLPGLTSGASYQFGVRAANATAEEKNTTVVTATPLATGPRPPEGLTGSAI